MKPGKLISIEGTEGAGKTTILNYVKTFFAKRNIALLVTREPGGTPMAEQIRQLLLNTKQSDPMTSKAELLLMFAARAQHLANCIQPALDAGKWVVSDRFVDASYAYQGGGRGLAMADINWLDQFVVGEKQPTLTLLLDIPPAEGFERTKQRGQPHDRIEQEKLAFFVRVRDAYLARAKLNPSRIKIIDASQPLANVQYQVADCLQQMMVDR